MKIQKATLLGLYAILELASQTDQQLSRTEIAEKFDVSGNHLSKVMRELVKAELVEAVRGAGGGYRFCGDARRTSLMDVISIFESFQPDNSNAHTPGKDTEVGMALDLVLNEIDMAIHATLSTTSISAILKLKERITAKQDNANLTEEDPLQIKPS